MTRMPTRKAASATLDNSKPKSGSALPSRPASRTADETAGIEAKPTKATKRRAEGASGEAQVNGIANKRLKSTQTSKTSATAKKRAASEQAVKSAAVKKPRAARKRIIINQASTTSLNVYVFGNGSSGGELGLGSGKGQVEVRRPRLNPHLSVDTAGVVQVACGGMHTACLTHDNKILTWGVNDQGALGRDTTWEGGLRDVTEDDNSEDDTDSDTGELNPHESTPEQVDVSGFEDVPVWTQISCSDNATFAVTDDGLSNEGIFGFSRKSFVQHQPILIDGLKGITKIACGSNHVLALDSKGDVYAWGTGQQNQLGRRIIERHQITSLTPTRFGLKKGMVDIGAGSYHSFAVHKDGDVYSWGLNSFGETGVPKTDDQDEADVHHPTIIQALRSFGKVTCITGGEHHSIAATDKGECLVWGRLDGFQLGIKLDTLPAQHLVRDSHGNARILTVPTPVPGVDAVQVAAGTDHCIAITRDGKAFSWGFSLSCQTGLGTEDDVEVATQIDNTAVRGKKLVWAGAGGQFSVVAGLPEEDGKMVNGVNGHV